MSIIIQNIDDNPRLDGNHRYQLRINDSVIAEFDHLREEGLSVCLRKAADAAEHAEAGNIDRITNFLRQLKRAAT